MQLPNSTESGNYPNSNGSEIAISPHPVLDQMGFTPISLDALQMHCKLETCVLQSELLSLELNGYVARLPGGLFQRLAQTP